VVTARSIVLRYYAVETVPYSIFRTVYGPYSISKLKKWGVQYAQIFFRIRTVCTIENTALIMTPF
jgi:hypothetical protein